jgi:hypothetical protein
MMLTIWSTYTIDHMEIFTKVSILDFKVITHFFGHPTTSFDLIKIR